MKFSSISLSKHQPPSKLINRPTPRSRTALPQSRERGKDTTKAPSSSCTQHTNNLPNSYPSCPAEPAHHRMAGYQERDKAFETAGVD
ncbi:uncharacterized protein N7529_011961 [Penicillium soppii]|uniref:uncharacterized protein n=1 Tax=Penicillium soppii TaxID=69789 RepID=UPI002546A51D|nr:uncharacterized protein N7529_011961 [Penicillium soppii]KAJ5852576.1 hypothetical protein N7529_011961 [Penicillium soppii]